VNQRTLKIRSLVRVVCVAALLPALAFALERGAPEDSGMSAQRLARLTEALQAYSDDERLAGSVTLVARRGKIVYLQAFGQRDLEAGDAMSADDIFRIASQSKAIVSVAVMMLEERGELLISDPVGKYLPAFQETTVAVPRDNSGYDVVRANRPITVRDLLTHTSGIAYGTGPGEDRWEAEGLQSWYLIDRNEGIREIAARMAALPAAAHPGQRWIYGYNTDILGALVEAVSGQPLDSFLQENILEPLGMIDTQFYLPRAKLDRLATVYSMQGNRLTRAPEQGGSVSQGNYVEGPRKAFSGGAGLLSTATDYARFLQMLLNGGELDGHRLLSRKTVELMTVGHLNGISFNTGQNFGLGFSVVEDVGARGEPGSQGEYGWGGAYHSTYWVDPVEQLVVVHLTQLIPAGNVDDQGKVRALVYQAIVD
jgi:CubicO group peptidase (beta-lactamase class C family)